MSSVAFKGSSYPIRADLDDAHKNAWVSISSAGTWLTGAKRVAIANEIREVLRRPSCANTREALSPESVPILNSSNGELNDAQVELIHRVVCDPGRLTKNWVKNILAMGMSEGEYIEIVGIIAMVMILDTCTFGLGLPNAELPASRSGNPSQYKPPGSKINAAWLPLVEPEDVVVEDGPMYPNPKAGYIYRGLSGVPQSLRDYWEVANSHYLPSKNVRDFDQSIRAIDRQQIELIAAKISALHQCAY
jgi:hypothetical protein